MSEWKEHKLKDIGCSFLSGFAFKSSDYSASGIPLIKIGNIQNTLVSIDDAGDFVSEKLIDSKTEKYLLSDKDVLIAMTGQGSVGRVGRLRLRNNIKPFLNQRVGKFICDEKNINIDYLYFILTSPKYQDLLFNTGVGSGQPNLSPELILNVEIPYTNYNEQTAIAEVLSSLDDKIDLLHRQNKTLEQLAETLFRQWFVEEAEESWEEKTLGEVADIKAGGDKPKVYSELKTEECNIPIYSNGIDDDGLYGYTDIARINTESITVSARGTIGFVCLRQEPYVPIVRLISIIPKENFISSKYLYLWAKAQNITGTGTTQEQLTVPDFSGTTLLLPSYDKMKEFTNYIDSLFIKIKSNKNQIKTLTQLRNILLPKLINGEVRVKN